MRCHQIGGYCRGFLLGNWWYSWRLRLQGLAASSAPVGIYFGNSKCSNWAVVVGSEAAEDSQTSGALTDLNAQIKWASHWLTECCWRSRRTSRTLNWLGLADQVSSVIQLWTCWVFWRSCWWTRRTSGTRDWLELAGQVNLPIKRLVPTCNYLNQRRIYYTIFCDMRVFEKAESLADFWCTMKVFETVRGCRHCVTRMADW